MMYFINRRIEGNRASPAAATAEPAAGVAVTE